MTEPSAGAPENGERRRRLSRRRDMVLLDYAILVLGVVSVLIFALSFRDLGPNEAAWLRGLDHLAIGFFALGFLAKVLVAHDHLYWLRKNWFALLGLLPLTTPVFVPERFYIIVQVAVVVSRFSTALDQAFGERILEQIFARYRAAIVEELTDPILERLVVILQENLSHGTYTASIGRTLERDRYKVRAAVEKAIDRSPKIQLFLRFPGVREKKDEAVEEMVDAAVEALTSEELNTLIQDAIYEAFEDLRVQIRDDRRWRAKGIGVGELATGLIRSDNGENSEKP